MFMHFGLMHILNNMVVLGAVGQIVEKAMGHVKLLIIFLVSGMCGSVLSYIVMLYNNDFAVSAGASGAIFGLVGALVWIVIANRGFYEGISRQQAVFMVILMIYYGVSTQGVDNWAHGGGLAGGFVISIVLYRKRDIINIISTKINGRRSYMKINIYYGGRGLLDDPTLYVISKIENVLKELRVKVERYNIYEHKNEIATLPQTFKDVDGIILATTVEWLGIGGYMQQFLDACWLYGDKEKISNTYMQPIVMSTTYGEREAETTLCNAWEILGGLPCSGLCGYVEDITTFQLNKEYNLIIENERRICIARYLRRLRACLQAIRQ